VPFFDQLADVCEDGLGVFAGMPRPVEGITPGELHGAQRFPAHNVHLFSGPLYHCYQRGFVEWLETWNPDALVVEANARYLATGSAVKWMHARGRKVIGWGLGAPPIAGPLDGLRRTRWLQFLRQFDGLVAYSQRGADEYSALGFPTEKIFVAPNAAVARPLREPAHKPQMADAPTILFVGRLQARKRIDALLHGCAQMPEPKPHLLIVGDGPERQKLEALAKQVYPEAQFVGAKYGDELAPYFADADLFVLPGTGGLAVQEAMAHGLPVMVAKGDGTQDDLVREGNGWQVPPEDEPALVETMRLALSDRKRLLQMGEESFRIVSEEINLEKMVEAFMKALSAVNP
jgi:glycosyltransferase involved in cell wall biosynthesis